MNRRIGACLGNSGVGEVLSHELGHVLGLGHSSDDAGEPDPVLRDATMFFLAHLSPETPRGERAAATGCACVDAGHEPCSGGNACTSARCDAATRRCVLEPVACAASDPCLAAACLAETGCATEPVAGYAAMACALARDFTPAACATDRVPGTFRDRVRQTERLVDRARGAALGRQDSRLGLLAENARLRIETCGAAMLFVPPLPP